MAASSFQGFFKLDKVYPLVNFNYSVNRDIDYEGRPASKLKNSIVDLEVEVPEGDIIFIKWLCLSELKDGTIILEKIDHGGRNYEIKFEQAFCISYKQIFASGPKAVTVQIRVSATKLSFTSEGQEFSHAFFANG